MDWITTSGRSLDEAKSHALDQLGIVADEAEFDIVNDVDKGLFGRIKSEAKIRARVRPKQPLEKDDRRRRSGGNRGRAKNQGRNKSGGGSSRNNGANERGNRERTSSGKRGGGASKGSGNSAQQKAPAKKKASRTETDNKKKAETSTTRSKPKPKKETVDHEFAREDQEKAAVDFLGGVLDVFEMTGDITVADEPAEDGAIEVAVSGSGLGLLVGQKGLTLNALQELTRTVVQREADGAKTERLRVDVAGYRVRRSSALGEFARKIASDVVESNTEKVLEPMGPADRKVVHDALNDVAGVETGSEGEEPRRRVVIRPV